MMIAYLSLIFHFIKSVSFGGVTIFEMLGYLFIFGVVFLILWVFINAWFSR